MGHSRQTALWTPVNWGRGEKLTVDQAGLKIIKWLRAAIFTGCRPAITNCKIGIGGLVGFPTCGLSRTLCWFPQWLDCVWRGETRIRWPARTRVRNSLPRLDCGAPCGPAPVARQASA